MKRKEITKRNIRLSCKSFTVKDMMKYIESEGYKNLRRKGSHIVYYNSDLDAYLVFPCHGNNLSKTQNFFQKVVIKNIELNKKAKN